VERGGLPGVITFFWTRPFAVGAEVPLEGDPQQHARARRVRTGEPVRLIDGKGRVGEATVERADRDAVVIRISRSEMVPPPVPLEVIVPVADRDRLLFAAEKCVELGITAWRPAYFERSRSVSPRGEGEKFRAKVRSRMQSALEQSGGAWLPEVHEERELAAVLAEVPAAWQRVLLDSRGTSLAGHITSAHMVLAVGPEGGLTPAELAAFERGGWAIASLGGNTLRFETAIIAAVSVVRALQHPSRESSHG